MMTSRTIGLLARRLRPPARSAVLRIGRAHDKMSMRKGRGSAGNAASTKKTVTGRYWCGRPDRAIPFRRQDSLPMDHSTPFSSRKGIVVLRPSVGPLELARGREVSR